jgi:hypothetical protein
MICFKKEGALAPSFFFFSCKSCYKMLLFIYKNGQRIF